MGRKTYLTCQSSTGVGTHQKGKYKRTGKDENDTGSSLQNFVPIRYRFFVRNQMDRVTSVLPSAGKRGYVQELLAQREALPDILLLWLKAVRGE